jgi:hypothetical protein
VTKNATQNSTLRRRDLPTLAAETITLAERRSTVSENNDGSELRSIILSALLFNPSI